MTTFGSSVYQRPIYTKCCFFNPKPSVCSALSNNKDLKSSRKKTSPGMSAKTLRPWVQSKIKDRTLRFRPWKTNVCWAPPADRGSKSQMRQKTRKEFIVIEFFVREGRGKEPKGHRPHSRTRFAVESSGEVSVHEEMGILWGRRERWSIESWRKIVRMFQESQS